MGKEAEQKQEIVNQGVHTYSQEDSYVWPQESVLLEQLEWFQARKKRKDYRSIRRSEIRIW